MISDHAAALRAISEIQKALEDGNRRTARGRVEQTNPSEDDVQMEKSSRQRGTFANGKLPRLLAVVSLLVMACLSCAGSFRNAVALIPRDIKTQTMTTAEGTYTPTSTSSLLATATIIPLKTATPQPTYPSQTSQSSIPIHIYFPAIAYSGIPTPTPVPTQVPFAGKTILVDLSDQRVYAYNGGKLVFNFIASTGRNHLTRPGHYKILNKIPNAYSAPWGFWMPNWMGIYYAGYNLQNGFHSLPVLPNGTKIWGNKIGTPVTYGCVVLMPNDMKKLYRWAGVGTAVVIQK